ncbi:battenin-like isoform X2 [Aphidius gifuensis]|nr:battenin-like isoform X2 [Aphidius gifuensis]
MNNKYEVSGVDNRTKWRNFIAFWVLGLCNNYGYVIVLSAAHDILESRFGNNEPIDPVINNSTTINSRNCNELSTGAILLADILPCLIVKLIGPFFPYYIHVRVSICIISSFTGFIAVALGTTKWMTIFGVVLTSIASGLGEASFMSYLHKYSKTNITAWSSGTGGAGIIGSISYAGLRMIFNIETTILVMLIVPISEAIAFWLILVHPKDKIIIDYGVDSQEEIIKFPKKNLKQKFELLPRLLVYAIPLGLVYLFEYFINMGLYELIQFDDIWLNHGEQYRWLQADYQIGVFISRSSASFITFNRIWLMAVFQFLNVILFTTEAILFYVPNIWIIFALTLWEGLLGGGAYVNTFHKMSDEIPSDDLRESLGIVTIADSLGITIAGWISMIGHDAICKISRPIR